MDIRLATGQDRNGVLGIYLSAFPEGENEIVARLAMDLLSGETRPPTISLIAEIGGAIVGHAAFSPVRIDSAESFLGYILAPLAVKPGYQRRGIGSKLIEYGVRRLSAMGVNVVFVYGDPKYYGRFGFSADAAREYTTPYRLQQPAGWQAMVLNEYPFKEAPRAIACVGPLNDPELW